MKNLQKWPLKPYLDVYSGEEVHSKPPNLQTPNLQTFEHL